MTFVEKPGGAFYAFFNVSSCFGRSLAGGLTVNNATDFCTALLEQAHVALVTGDAFGAPRLCPIVVCNQSGRDQGRTESN